VSGTGRSTRQRRVQARAAEVDIGRPPDGNRPGEMTMTWNVVVRLADIVML